MPLFLVFRKNFLAFFLLLFLARIFLVFAIIFLTCFLRVSKNFLVTFLVLP